MSPAARPSVSVITPSLNQARFLGRTLRSVAGQGLPDLDHFVVDGGSTDGTLDVLRAAARPGLRWVSEPDRGQAQAVNKGISGTSGEIIAWINSDDIYYPGTIAGVLDHFAANPEVDVVYGAAQHIDADDAVIDRYPTRAFDAGRLRQVCFICQPAAFFRRRCVATSGPLDERLQYCMDYEFWLRLARAGARFSYLPRVLSGSRLHRDAKTLRARPAVHREVVDMFRRTTGSVPLRWLLGRARESLVERLRRTENA